MSHKYPELVFGLVGAIEAELELVQRALLECLATVGYTAVDVRLSDLMRELNPSWCEIPPRSDPKYYERAMDAGNKLRADMNRNDAMAGLAIASTRRRREKNKEAKEQNKEQNEKRAYILTLSLAKTPSGVKFLGSELVVPRQNSIRGKWM